MKLFTLCTVALSLFCLSARADDKAQWAVIGKAMMAFPEKPTEGAFRSIESKLGALPPAGSAEDERHGDLLGATFLARASERHGWAITGQSRFDKQAREILSGKGRLAAYLRDDKLIDSSKFDVWWMGYLASQDDRYLDKLLVYAGSPTPKDDLGKAMLVSVATWSFKSNCQQLKGVREFARQRANDPAYKDKRAFLLGCLKDER